jgi:hypothetical protein
MLPPCRLPQGTRGRAGASGYSPMTNEMPANDENDEASP